VRPALIVDDEPLVRLTLRSMIPWARWGFVCSAEASNGAEALEVMAAHPDIALVILDLVMPGMDGLEFLRRLRERPGRPEVIVLTAHDEFPMVREAFQLGAVDYLLKSELEPERLAPLLHAASLRMERHGGALGDRGHAVALKQEALRRLLDSEQPVAIVADLEERGIRLGPFFCLGLLTVRDFAVVAARYDTGSLGAFPLGLMAAVQQVLDRYARAEVLHLEDDTYVLFLPLAENAGANAAERCKAAAEDIRRALSSYLDVAADVAWSHVIPALGGPAPAALYHALHAGRDRPSRVVERARERIRAGYTDPELHLVRLAEELGVTPNHLSGQFARETGRSFRSYLALVRVEAAKRLLAGSNLKVREVAERVGYLNVEHFSRVFKKQTGVAPHLFTRGPR
jgi:CheY-like chemotaxis protein/AraC-like DNA-binding protein